MQMKIEELKQEEVVTPTPEVESGNQEVVLTKEKCLEILVKMLHEKVKPVLSFQEVELVNKGLRFLDKKPQMVKLEEELNEKVVIDLLTQAVILGHRRNSLSFEDGSLMFHVFKFLSDLQKTEEEKKE